MMYFPFLEKLVYRTYRGMCDMALSIYSRILAVTSECHRLFFVQSETSYLLMARLFEDCQQNKHHQ